MVHYPALSISVNRCGLGPNILTTPSEELYNGVAAPATVAAIVEVKGVPALFCAGSRQTPYTPTTCVALTAGP